MWLIYALLSAIFAAGVAIVGRLGLKNIDSTLATTIRAVIMAVFLLIVSLLLKKFNNFSFNSFSSKDWWLITFFGIFGALSWLFYFFALKGGPATAVVAIDAFNLMKRFGLGISNKDFDSYKDGVAPDRLSGRILIKTEDSGRAYYVNPLTSIMEYLGRPQDAFKLLLNSSLGITNESIRKIDVGK